MKTETRQGKGLSVAARFTKGRHPFDGIAWEKRTASVSEEGGALVFEMKDVRVPSSWSQLATDILASKYCRKAEVPESMGGNDKGQEHDAECVVSRITLAIRKAGQEAGGYFATDEDALAFRSELSWLLIHQVAAFNSPVWFNLGLAEAYGIKGSAAETFCWDPLLGRTAPSPDGYSRPQVSACFIRGVQDDLGHIMRGVGEEARLFKFGSGVGSNFSPLRAEGEPLRNGGTSSGLMSWLEIYDKAAGAIKSGGTTRRAAKMVILDDDHPDVFKFVRWKAREEDKKRVLLAAGFGVPGDVNSEAERTVSGQNANNSVRVTDAFMRMAQTEGGQWTTRFRTSEKPAEVFLARKLWDEIAFAAWKCADPGLQFHDTVNRWHTCPVAGPIKGSNPCSEYMFLDDSSCNLASLNLVKFIGDDGTFDVEGFMHAVRVLFIAMEILVDHASYPSDVIARNSHEYRPLGIGYANLGALLMRKGLPYDSRGGCALAASITSLMTGHAYEVSAEMAASKGAFLGFSANREPMLRVMAQHRDASARISATWGLDSDEDIGSIGIEAIATKTWNRAIDLGSKHGYRNAQASVLAPTGTIGLLMDCDTTGVEPDYALVKKKKLAGGGDKVIANQSVGPALEALGYVAGLRERILGNLASSGTLVDVREEDRAVFACASGEGAISPLGHVRMMEAVQPFISGAISKTVNMAASSTVEDVASIYREAWMRGIKAIAIYRDGSKAAQPLNEKKLVVEPSVQVRRGERIRLSKKRTGGFTLELKVGTQRLYLRTGTYPDGKLGEIFVDLHKEGSTMRSLMNCFAISTSLGLQYGVPLEKFVGAFSHTRFEPSGAVDHPRVKRASSIIDALFRILGIEYLGRDDLAHVIDESLDPHSPEDRRAEDVKSDAPFCTACGQLTRRTGNCHVCDNCGTSAGCS